MKTFKFLSIAVLTMFLYGCATTTGSVGKFGEDLDVKRCEGAGDAHEDKYTIVETSYTSSFQGSTPRKHFSGIKNVKIEGSKLRFSLIDKSLYEEYSTPLVTKLDEIHHDAHPLGGLFTGLGYIAVVLPAKIAVSPLLIWDKNYRSEFWGSPGFYKFVVGCTEKKLLSPEHDLTKKTKTGKTEWRDTERIHKFLVSGFNKDYEFSKEYKGAVDLSTAILNTDLTNKATIKITCLDCDLLGQEGQALYKDAKKTVEITADFREIKATLLAEEKTKRIEQAQHEKEAAIQRVVDAKEALQRRKETQGVPLGQFKEQCQALGFKVGTADYGNCVLELNEAK